MPFQVGEACYCGVGMDFILRPGVVGQLGMRFVCCSRPLIEPTSCSPWAKKALSTRRTSILWTLDMVDQLVDVQEPKSLSISQNWVQTGCITEDPGKK